MTAKLALIVDDSKSARFVLQRMLKEFNLEVDTAESAMIAIDYLKHNRPDVIFMDHMMPGMDGFEAVKRIKENPLTAVIPIMMYTSKGGDVYLSQARALGAVGLIPKTISAVDLKESLLKLQLIEDIVEPAPEDDKQLVPKTDDALIEEKLIKKQNVLDLYINDLRRLMDDQTVELHKSMWLGIESVSNEIFNRLNTELEDRLDKIQPAPQETGPEHAPKDKTRTSWPVYTVSLLLIFSIIFNILLFFNIHTLENKLVVANEKLTTSPKTDSETDNNSENNLLSNKRAYMEFIKWANNKTIKYPYNELALNDSRLPGVKELVKKALEAEFTGSIILQTHAGRFCLSIDQNGVYRLADDNLPVAECDYVGNYMQPSDVPSTHQSLSFANYLSYMGLLSEKGITIEVTSVPRYFELPAYPERGQEIEAEEWNHAAQLNNRITIILKPTDVGL